MLAFLKLGITRLEGFCQGIGFPQEKGHRHRIRRDSLLFQEIASPHHLRVYVLY